MVLQQNMECANKAWVPYDVKTSPLDNLFDKPTDLDPQPEYTLRTNFVYYHEEVQAEVDAIVNQEPEMVSPPEIPVSNAPPASMLFTLWVFGLIVWCMVFVNQGGSGGKVRRKRKKAMTKDV